MIRHGVDPSFGNILPRDQKVGARVSIFSPETNAFHSLSKMYGVVLCYHSGHSIFKLFVPLSGVSLGLLLSLLSLSTPAKSESVAFQGKNGMVNCSFAELGSKVPSCG